MTTYYKATLADGRVITRSTENRTYRWAVVAPFVYRRKDGTETRGLEHSWSNVEAQRDRMMSTWRHREPQCLAAVEIDAAEYRKLRAQSAQCDWAAGRLAGLRRAGIGTNPHAAGTVASDEWENGYKSASI